MLWLSIILPVFPLIYEDFKYRAIHWIWIALLLLSILLFHPVKWWESGINVFFLCFQLGILTLYFSIKNKRWTNITLQYLGLGDIVFFIPLCLIFSPINLILFFVLSLTFSLFGFLIYNTFSHRKANTIPLAGCMSIGLILIIVSSFIFDFSLNSDLWYMAFFL